jgi:hypothetical protein
MSEIDASLEGIETRQDLVAFVDLLVKGVEEKTFDEHSVVTYLDRIARGLEGLGESAPKSPDWRLLGRVLLTAFFR